MRASIAVLLAGCGRIGFDAISSSAGNGDANGDGIGGDGGTAAVCNSFDRFADDFDDGITDRANWNPYADTGTSYAEQGGDLVLTPAANTSAIIYTGYQTKHAYDLRDTRVVAQYTQVPNGGAGIGIDVRLSGTEYVTVNVYNNMMFASQTTVGTYTTLAQIPFDSANRFWAVAERGGRIYYETSQDGVTFTPFHDIAEPFSSQSVRVHLFAGTELSIASPGVARFAAFNPGKVPRAGCPISTFTDDFADGLQGGWDEIIDSCCTMQESAGALTFSTSGASGHAVRTSRAGYDLRNGEVTVRVSGGPSQTSAFDARLFVHVTDQNEVDLRIGGAAVTARTIINGTPNNVGVARTGSENYLRIRETAGTLFFETSPDKSAWEIGRAHV